MGVLSILPLLPPILPPCSYRRCSRTVTLYSHPYFFSLQIFNRNL